MQGWVIFAIIVDYMYMIATCINAEKKLSNGVDRPTVYMYVDYSHNL